MLGMHSAVKGGFLRVPGSMLTVALVKLLPNGKSTPMGPGMDKFPAENMEWYRESLAGFFDLALAGKMKPVIADTFPLPDAAKAHEFMERGGYAGKVVLTAES